ncbi:26S proteasome subunit RPN7-domain-containing protein [Gorgonomyces haynaldii]|nr:26S proteasome subunit RPN7-domain-containing protein [Gorgonomyces haynaldii]
MAPFFEYLVQQGVVQKDDALLKQLQQQNDEELKKLDEKLKDAQENLGETEVSDILMAKATYLAKIGSKDGAIQALNTAIEKTGPLGHRIDLHFTLLRVGFFYDDAHLLTATIERVKKLIDEGGDWDRRNRLKVYQGIFLLSKRDFKTGAHLLLDTLGTFTSTELMEYRDFVRYAAIAAAITLERPDFKAKVLNSPEVLEVIHEIPHVQEYISSFYNCSYATFFKSLAEIEQILKHDRFLHLHYRFYVREMRIRVYAQLLESYRSLTIESMANSFGVTEDWIDSDLCQFIAAGRLNAVIDKVNGIVETNRPDFKNAQYQATIKQGDLLLTRIQKLSRVINV